MRGDLWQSSALACGLTEHHPVTPGEREVLSCVRTGMSDAAIARQLNADIRAVQSRLRRFYERTGLSGRVAVGWTVEHFHCCLNERSVLAQ